MWCIVCSICMYIYVVGKSRTRSLKNQFFCSFFLLLLVYLFRLFYHHHRASASLFIRNKKWRILNMMMMLMLRCLKNWNIIEWNRLYNECRPNQSSSLSKWTFLFIVCHSCGNFDRITWPSTLNWRGFQKN